MHTTMQTFYAYGAAPKVGINSIPLKEYVCALYHLVNLFWVKQSDFHVWDASVHILTNL